MPATRTWKVYGASGHRQRESFCDSYMDDFSKGDDIRIIEVFNSDKTHTNEYSVVRITRNTYEECELELDGQLSDGIFENSRTGLIVEVDNDWPMLCASPHQQQPDRPTSNFVCATQAHIDGEQSHIQATSDNLEPCHNTSKTVYTPSTETPIGTPSAASSQPTPPRWTQLGASGTT